MQRRLVDSFRQQATIDAQQLVRDLATTIAEEGDEVGEVGSTAWRRTQQRVQGLHESPDGFVCVVDTARNLIICHPTMRSTIEQGDGAPMFAALRPPKDAERGWSNIDNQQLAIGRNVSNSTLAVVSFQSNSRFVRQAKTVLLPLRIMGSWVAIITAICSGVMVSSVAAKYEHKISNVNRELEHLVSERMDEFTRTRDAIIYGLARLAESRDTDTGAHLDRIQHYSTLLAQQLANQHPVIDTDYITKLRLASTLHDIGKVGIPDEILLKPGRLTETERKVMQQHAVIGSQCLREIRERLGEDDFLDMAYNIAAGHHEWWDGHGYPNGIAAQTIPLEARIVAVADVYDALRSRRVYKDSMSHERARQIINEGRATQFDPEVVDVFNQCSERFEAISQKSADVTEVCLLEKIRECLADAQDAADVDRSLSFLRDEATAEDADLVESTT